jgi:hypothetical protein
VRWLFVSLSLVVLLAGCGDSEPADETVSELVEALSDGDYATAWELLHSDHQKIVDEQLFVDCGTNAASITSARVESFSITGEVERDRTVPELGEVEVTEVGVNLTQGGQTSYRTWDVIKDDGDWRWLMAEEQLNSFREGDCPSQTF